VVGAIFPIGEEIVYFASYLHGLYAFTDAKIRYLSQNSKGLGGEFSQNSEVFEGDFSQNSRNCSFRVISTGREIGAWWRAVAKKT
jgi:hypothetical protein